MTNKRFFFVDTEIYYQNEKQPPRMVELFLTDFITKDNTKYCYGYDKDGNDYLIPSEEIIVKDDEGNLLENLEDELEAYYQQEVERCAAEYEYEMAQQAELYAAQQADYCYTEEDMDFGIDGEWW